MKKNVKLHSSRHSLSYVHGDCDPHPKDVHTAESKSYFPESGSETISEPNEGKPVEVHSGVGISDLNSMYM